MQSPDQSCSYSEAAFGNEELVSPKDVLIYSALSLMKRLAIRLSQQAGKSLVIPRRRESIYIKALDIRLAESQFILSLSKDGDDE